MKTIYVAGPMRGIPRFNFPAFDQMRDYLKSNGWNVISPADLDRSFGFDETNFPDDYDWIDLKKIGFKLTDAVLRDSCALCKCDAIAMLPGWENSKGAVAERAIAMWLGLEVLYFNKKDMQQCETAKQQSTNSVVSNRFYQLLSIRSLQSFFGSLLSALALAGESTGRTTGSKSQSKTT